MKLNFLKAFRKRAKNEHQLIKRFFRDQKDYLDFLTNGEQMVVENEAGTCKAEIRREGEVFLYTLTWLDDGMFIGDFVKPFKANNSNIECFNKGCRTIAKRMEAYLRNKDINDIPDGNPAFGLMTVREEVYGIKTGCSG